MMIAELVDRRLFKTFDLGDDVHVIERVNDPAGEVAERRFGTFAGHYWAIDATRQIGAKGLAGFLQKPFTISELNEKINAILRVAAVG